MFGFLIIIAIVIAVMKHRHFHIHARHGRKSDYRFRNFGDTYFEKKSAKFDKHGEVFERKAGIASAEEEEKRYATYEERLAYRKARKQAAREAGFYGHLMVYASTIGFLFLINLLTTSYPWFLCPPPGWGFSLFIHYMLAHRPRSLPNPHF